MKSSGKLLGSSIGCLSKFVRRAVLNYRDSGLPYCQIQQRLYSDKQGGPGLWHEKRENTKIATEDVNSHEWNSNACVRNASLDFLTHSAARGLDYTSASSDADFISRNSQSHMEEPLLSFIKADDPLVLEWSKQSLESSSNKDWSRVEQLLKESEEGKYCPSLHTLQQLMDRLMQSRQFRLAIYLFETFRPILKDDKGSICNVIEAAFKNESYQQCEELFSKYMAIAMHDTSIQLIMLKCFIANYNLTVARAFLEQIWDDVTNEHIDAYIKGISFVACNSKELQRVLKLWMDSCNGMIAPQTLAFALTGYLRTEDDANFADCLFTAKDLGIFDHPLIQKVLLEKALILRDYESFSKTARHMASNNIPLSRSPFRRAIGHFCKERDMSSVSYTCKLMIHHGFEVDTKIFNTLLLAGASHKPDFNIVNYLDQGAKSGICRNRSTFEYVRRALVKKYARNGLNVNEWYIEGLLKMWPHENWIKEMTLRMKVFKVTKTRRYKTSSSVDLLLDIQKCVWTKPPQVAMRSIDDLMRQGIMPQRGLFMAAMTRFLKKKNIADFDTVLHKYVECGHKVDANVELFMLQRDIIECPTNINLQSYTKDTVRSFVAKYPNLPLEKRVTLGYLLFDVECYDEAATLFDSKRVDGENIGTINHTSGSLTGLLDCYRHKMDLVSAERLVKDILEGDRDIELYKEFFKILRACHRRAAENIVNESLALEFEKLLGLCISYQKEVDDKIRLIVENSLKSLKHMDSTTKDETSDEDSVSSMERGLNISFTTTNNAL